MIEIILWLIISIGVLRFSVALLNLISQPLLTESDSPVNVKLSVLIPARNEAGNLPQLLESLLKQQVDWHEVLILDDHSTDTTALVVAQYIQKNSNIRLIKGMELPKGWLGKNFACHQLSKFATGKYFLFLDADVLLLEGAIKAAVNRITKTGTVLLSLFPDQKMESAGEKLVVPIMHYFLLSNLPLIAVLKSKQVSLAAANGQFMLFEASAYRKNMYHKAVKSNVVEDVAIIRNIKECGQKGEVLLGNHLVKARMYRGLQNSIEGFSKNIFEGFGRNWLTMIAYFCITILAWIPVLIWGSWFQVIFTLIIVSGIRICISIISHQSLIQNILFHPFQMALFIFTGFRSAWLVSRGKVMWKGRGTNIQSTINNHL